MSYHTEGEHNQGRMNKLQIAWRQQNRSLYPQPFDGTDKSLGHSLGIVKGFDLLEATVYQQYTDYKDVIKFLAHSLLLSSTEARGHAWKGILYNII